jgi:hypothetical protein
MIYALPCRGIHAIKSNGPDAVLQHRLVLDIANLNERF